MDKKTFKEKMCKSCINYCEKCLEEDIQEKIIDGVQVMKCKNYHKWTECITKSCRACGKCNRR